MAQSIVYTDDLSGDAGAEPVSFAIDGTSYTIDLAEKNAKKLRDFLAQFVAVATVVEKAPANRARPKSGGAYDYDPVVVRDWWKDNEKRAGQAFSQKGRVPTAVVDAWKASGRR
jgi:hypothetical protein